MKTILLILFAIILPLLSCENNSPIIDNTPIKNQDKAILINHNTTTIN